jgi:cell division protein DivIC
MPLHKFPSLLLKIFFSKYTIVVAIFFAYLIFFDDHNLIRKYRMRQEIKALQNELSMYRNEIEKNSEEITRLKTDTVYLEKVAREKYLMKGDDEDIFLFNDVNP